MADGLFKSWLKRFQSGTIVLQLTTINVVVFLLYKIVDMFCMLFQVQNAFSHFFYREFTLAGTFGQVLIRPWTMLTYMFVHTEVFHWLFNVLWLYYFGSLAERFFSYKHIRGLYLLGGLAGGVLYLISYNIFPAFAVARYTVSLLGASASILAIVMAVTTREPNFQIQLLLVGRIKLKYLTLFLIVLDVLFISVENPGGHIAHLGGILVGWWFVRGLDKGYDLTRWINGICDGCLRIGSMFNRKPKMKVHYHTQPRQSSTSDRGQDYAYNARKKAESDEIDRILDKLRKSGYANLSDEEKKSLFDASKK